jgi:hypothetical protein
MKWQVCGSEEPDNYIFGSNCGHSRYFIPAADRLVPPERLQVVESGVSAPEPPPEAAPAGEVPRRPRWAVWRRATEGLPARSR